MTTTNENAKLVRAVKAVGIRAVKVVERAAGDGAWTEDAVLRAAGWLEVGAKEGGLARAWPNLAARLRNLVATHTATAQPNSGVDAGPTRSRAKSKSAKAAPEPIAIDTAPTTTPPARVPEAPPVDPAALPFSEFCEKYLKHLEGAGKSRGTVFSYSLDLSVAARHFGETRDVKSITVEDVAAYFESDVVTKNKGGGAKNAITVAKLRRTLRMALEWGAKAGWLWVAPIPVAAKAKDAADAAKASHEASEVSASKAKRGRTAKTKGGTTKSEDAPSDAVSVVVSDAPAAPSAT